jgi:hypothetical protein
MLRTLFALDHEMTDGHREYYRLKQKLKLKKLERKWDRKCAQHVEKIHKIYLFWRNIEDGEITEVDTATDPHGTVPASPLYLCNSCNRALFTAAHIIHSNTQVKWYLDCFAQTLNDIPGEL